jgi:hypothetical protein
VIRLPSRVHWAALALPLVLTAGNRPDLYRIPLSGTGPASRLTGTAILTPARSPFGIATTRDGHFVFQIEVAAPSLPAPATYGAQFTTYVAWVTTAQLDRIERIGALLPATKAAGRFAMSKFMVVVTAEPDANRVRWSGPIVLRGLSPSSYLTNFSGHTMFNGGMPQ